MKNAFGQTLRTVRNLFRSGCLASAFVILISGCVDINDAKVQVRAPGEMDPYARNVLDKCAPHTYPHQLIRAEISAGATIIQGSGVVVNNQQDFDFYWGNLSNLQPEKPSSDGILKPVVDWAHNSAHFLVIPLNNSCEKADLESMTTDCYDIFFVISRKSEGTDCQPRSANPAFVFVYPKTTLPISLQWAALATPTPGAVMTATPLVTPTLTPSPK